MRMIRFCLPLLLLITTGSSYSQEKKETDKWQFRSLNQAGLLQGEDASAFLLQTVNGFEKNNLFAGIGAGLDFYGFKSIPLFADFRKYIGHSNHRFFVYADPGVSFVWEKKDKTPGYTSRWNAGFYGDGGIGYRWNFTGGTGLLISTGYSYKRITEKLSSETCPFIGPCFTQVNTYRYNLNRLAIKIGLVF